MSRNKFLGCLLTIETVLGITIKVFTKVVTLDFQVLE